MIVKYFDEAGHLDDQGIALYVDALQLDRIHQLPKAISSHIDSCTACHSQALDLYAILSEADYRETAPHPQLSTLRPRRSSLRHYWWQIAAVVALVALSILFLTREELAPAAPQELVQDSIPSQQQAPHITAEQPDDSNTEQKTPAQQPKAPPQQPQLLAAHFVPDEEMEAMVGEVYRDEGLTILAPQINQQFGISQPIDFAWKEKTSQNIYLYVLNNRGEEVHKAILISNRFQLSLDLPQGLYYWKLESEDDLLYLGKINIRP